MTRVLYCPADELQETREKYRWYLKYDDIDIKPLPKLALPKDKVWELSKDYNDKPVGIKTWEPTPFVVEDGFTKLTYMIELEVLAYNESLGQYTKFIIPSRELSEDEREWAKEKFRELLLKEQEALLKRREFARKIMAGEVEEE